LLLLVVAVLWWTQWWRPLWDLAAPETTADFWALAGGLVNIAILAVAVRGLRSLALTRSAMLTQARKDARQSAVLRCHEMANEIIALNQPIINAFAEYKIPVFVHAAEDARFEPDNVADLDAASMWCQELPEGTFGDCIVFLNRLEAWSMYFTSQLADPQIAFGPCASYFCSVVVQNYPVLLHVRNRAASSGKYPNLVALYTAWSEQIADEQLSKMLTSLQSLQRRGSPSSRLKSPLGTELDE